MKQIPAIRNAEAARVRPRIALHRARAEGHSFNGTRPVLSNHGLLRRPAGVLQTKLIIGKPNDQFEREADLVANHVMRMPGGTQDSGTKVFAPSNHSLQRKCSCGGAPGPTGECEECRKKRETGVLQRFPTQPSTPNSQLSEVLPIVYDVLRGPGQPLDAATRAFMEPRFGHNFSHVRIHTGQAAASTSQSLQAAAFTFGSDIFFNTGQYRPDTASGFGLLAHELSHVIQQQAGSVSRRLIQRAKISYRTLTWANFKGTPDEGSEFAAETSSGFDEVAAKSKKANENTKTKCKLGKKESTEFKATISSDLAVFGKIAAHMTEEKSWVKSGIKDKGNSFCTKEVAGCEKSFDKDAADAKKKCQPLVTQCEEAFKNPDVPSFSIGEGHDALTITNAAECKTTLFKKCQELSMKDVDHALTDDDGKDFATAKKKGDCTKDFRKQCLAHETAESKRLLKHEQGHFDISNVMAKKAKASLKAKEATLTTTETRCGRAEALKAAQDSFDNLDAPTVLSLLQQDWITSASQAQSDYDVETDHGAKKVEQLDWETTKIAGGLKTYDPTAPAPAAAPPATLSPPPTP